MREPTARYTKGPWTVLMSAGIDYKGNMEIAEACDGEHEANARLISAAPDLLEALKALMIDANRLCDRNLGGTYEEDCRRSLKLAHAAKAKADGLAPIGTEP